MPPPVLPAAGPYNPWADASGRNPFQRAWEITRDTVTGSVADVKTAGGLLPGKTGAVGEKTRTDTGFGFDTKSAVVYGIAILFVVIGVMRMLK